MGLHTLLLKWDANFYIFSNKDLLDKFFDYCREYQKEIPPQEMAAILRDYADRLGVMIATGRPKKVLRE